MLSYALAITVAASSLAVFLTAFFMSDIHRRDDFLWSGVGLFYALVLWFCARNITGAVLLGQAAAATLLVSYSWQTLKLRKAVANPEQTAEITNFSVLRSLNNLLSRNKSQPQAPVVPPVERSTDKVTEEIAIPNLTSNKEYIVPEEDKSGVLDKFFGRKKSIVPNTKLDEIVDDEPAKQSNQVAIPVPPVEQKTEPVVEPEKPTADDTDVKAIATTQEVLELSQQPQMDVEEESTVEPPPAKDLLETSEPQLEQPKEDTVIDNSEESEAKVAEQLATPVEALETNPTVDNSEQLEVETEEKAIAEPVEVLETNPTVDNSEQLEIEIEDKAVADSVDDTSSNPTIDNSEQLELKAEDKPVAEPVKLYENTPPFSNFNNELESEKIENKTVEAETNPSILVPETPPISVEEESETLAKEASETQNDEADSNISQGYTDFNLADFSTEESESYPQNEPVAKPSSLDSLETVEVAEVLEALPDDPYSDRDLDKSNIIEVTTTDINITTEVKKIDSDPKENLDQN